MSGTASTSADENLLQLVTAAKKQEGAILPELRQRYRGLVGALLYLSVVCRPDISLAVSMLSRALETPTEDLWRAARRVLMYLAGTRELGIRWTVGGSAVLTGMVDADWATVRSTTGYCYWLADAVVAYLAKGQPTIALSSTEAEIMAACLAALEAVFTRGLLKDVGLPQLAATPLGIDNKGALALAHDYVSNNKTKHIERRHLRIRELVEDGTVAPEYVPTEDNVADILTKPLGRRRFEKLRRKLLNHA